MDGRAVLVSGGGIAGSTLAYWLARRGFAPTVVERAGDLRSSGSPVDVRGAAVPVAEQMGIMAQLREAATRTTRLTFVDGRGRRVGGLGMRSFAEDDRDVEVPRGALASVVHRAGRDDAEYVFGDSVATIAQDEGGVDVTFEHGAPRRFDVVVGADGLHSTVRRLAFGAEHEFVRYMGMYVATVPLGVPADDAHEILTYNTPGRAVTIHPGTGQALAAFMFRRPEVTGFDHRDTRQHERLLFEAFGDGDWRVPELLDRVRTTDDLYFDAVSKVSLPRWSSGRVALVGDASSCLSLFGDGSSLAMTGAAALADALAESPADVPSALARYEAAHRTRVAPKQRNMTVASRLIVPTTRLGILGRNAVTRLVDRR